MYETSWQVVRTSPFVILSEAERPYTNDDLWLLFQLFLKIKIFGLFEKQLFIMIF